MKEERYFLVPDAETTNQLPQDEATHALRVLRMKEGDEFVLMNGKGKFLRAVVTMAQGKHCNYDIIETLSPEKAWEGHLHIAMAPTKMMERVEWMVEKSTEVGCDEFSFLLCKFSERKQLRTDRVEKIVVSATKQSRKPWKPVVNDLQAFADFINTPREGLKFICHCYNEIERTDFYEEITKASSTQQTDANASSQQSNDNALLQQSNNDSSSDHSKDITVLVGPEGDFSIEEVQMAIKAGYKSVTLGKSRLRTETAGLSAVMMMQLARRK